MMRIKIIIINFYRSYDCMSVCVQKYISIHYKPIAICIIYSLIGYLKYMDSL